MTVRVRFAPSPTGTLHLGTARTALYNWLYARHFGEDGTYVLRIEDTDQERSTPEHCEQALGVFRWLGLTWDEGPEVGGPYAPYFQSERGDRHRAALDQLRASGDAYECFCTREQLDDDRAAAQAEGRPLVYAGRCRDLEPADRIARREAGEPHVWRFRMPDGETVVEDLILGESRFDNALIGDTVIARADGSVLYNFANVVDDADMAVTHVIRGNDHISNTPKQVPIYHALGRPVPKFAHVPMILDPSGKKLSKRSPHASTIEQLAHAGYTADAVRNGLVLIGWSLDDETTVMSLEQMIAGFDIADVNKSNAKVDYDKLKWINGQHLRAMAPEDWGAAYEGWRDEWLPADDPFHEAAFTVDGITAARLVQEKVDTFGEVPALVAFLHEPFEMTEQAWEKLSASPDALLVLDHVREKLDEVADWDLSVIEGVLRGSCEALERKPKVVFGPVRFAVTGRTITPGLWESVHVLGRDRALARLDSARERLSTFMD